MRCYEYLEYLNIWNESEIKSLTEGGVMLNILRWDFFSLCLLDFCFHQFRLQHFPFTSFPRATM